MPFIPLSSAASEMSTNKTSLSLEATTCAIPEPIVPEPTTPTILISSTFFDISDSLDVHKCEVVLVYQTVSLFYTGKINI